MFFADGRQHFFRPLTGKYREQVVACLRALYARLFSDLADYSRSFNRDQIIELFQETLTRTPLLDDEGEEAAAPRSDREQAGWVLNLLLEHGWLEKHMDEATLESSYAFSRVGRLFTQPMVELAGGRFRTRHRNTRNTRNALQSFLDKGEVYDLLDAYEYSERIVSDFSDIIAELDERKRQLVREVEAQQLVQRASDEFFDFMEKRFMPDLAIRLSADSVEKYRDEIADLIKKARSKRKEFRANAERELRRAAPELVKDERVSLFLTILDGIDSRVHNAAEVMLPALRRALHGFTRRADIIIRQLTFTGSGSNAVIDACQTLAALDDAEFDARLARAGDILAVLNVGFVDPDGARLQTGPRKRVVSTRVEEFGPEADDPDTRRQLFIQRAVEQAFSINNKALREYLAAALTANGSVSTAALPVNDARDLLYLAHAIEAGAEGAGGEYRFKVTRVKEEEGGVRYRNDYFEGDEFLIELVEAEHVPE
ncbi:MAG: Wadjet anti-phage system protein JetA family protein [Thiohalomonadaceae bacterium]